jgi:hypothetical protein
MKKQLKSKKLTLQRETLADLQKANGGLEASQLNNTVYYPQPSDNCTRGCPVLS